MQAEALRVREGASPATPGARLAELARDTSVTVRASLAMNPAAPREVVVALAHDADERVRTLLAHRLAALVPTLPADTQARLRTEVWETLTALAMDEAERVRAVVAEEIKSLPDAPHGLILCLAHDPAGSVHDPVIRFSPLLTTEDLIALLARPATRTAVARREGVAEPVADALVATGDAAAIGALLENPSARIREATLDALVTESAARPAWHAPLVARPALSAGALATLAGLVGEQLLERMIRRGDLPEDVAATLRQRIAARLGGAVAQDPLAQARAMLADGRLDEAAFQAAIAAADPVRLGSMLAVAAGVSPTVVQRAIRLRSAQGLVSLAWKAGLPMLVAGGLQAVLGGLPAGQALPAARDGGYPMTAGEMAWQLDFLSGRAVEAPKAEVHVWGAG